MNFYMHITGSSRGPLTGNSTKLNRIGWIEILECAPETLDALGLSSDVGGTRSMQFTIRKEGSASSPTLFQPAYTAGFQLGSSVIRGLGSRGGTGSGSGAHGRKHPIVITKQADSASPQLMQACLTNEAFSECLLDIADPSGTGAEGTPTRLSLVGARVVDIRSCLRPTAANGRLSHDIFLHYQGFRHILTA